MAPMEKQTQLLDLRRTLRRAADSVEGDAAVKLLDHDIAAATGRLKTADTLEAAFRYQGEIRALERYRKYLTEDPIIDRNQ